MKKGLRSVLVLFAIAATLITSGLVFAQPNPSAPVPRGPEGRSPMMGQAPLEPPAPPSSPSPRGFPGGDPFAQLRGAQMRDPGSALTVYAIVFSPGDHPFYKFGHNAIWIHDVSGRNPMLRDRVYNYGTFSFGDPALIPKFVLGRFMYWLSEAPIGWTKAAYAAENRGIIAQELDLTSEQKLELQQKLEENLLPENRYYKYDYYRDNCSTRVRDMLDSVTGGRIKAASTGPARLTYRQQTERLTADLPAEEVALDLAMGDFIDKPVTLWEEEFIPMELQKTLRTVNVPGADGVDHPLVKREFVLVPTDRVDPPLNPPSWWPYSLISGLVVGGILALLGKAGQKSKAARVLFGTSLSFFGLILGFLGCFFVFVWIVTDHVVGYRNENIFLCAPWVIVLTGTGIRVALNRVRSILFAYKLITAALVFALLGTVLKVLPWFDQKNGFFVLFFVPFWLGAAFGIRAMRERALVAVDAVSGTKASTAKAVAGADGEKPVAKKTKSKTKSKKPTAAVVDKDASTHSDEEPNASVEATDEKAEASNDKNEAPDEKARPKETASKSASEAAKHEPTEEKAEPKETASKPASEDDKSDAPKSAPPASPPDAKPKAPSDETREP